MARRTYVWDTQKKQMVEKSQRPPEAAPYYLKKKFVSFQSPIDGTVIHGDRALRDHNKRHNVVNASEFSPEFYEKKAKERYENTYGETADRKRDQVVRDAFAKHGL
tara:strand:+ start:328 stop:645 length:318 start_codon:yes stop_codon:yes gene_type:complete